jgi:hypothetical protein
MAASSSPGCMADTTRPTVVPAPEPWWGWLVPWSQAWCFRLVGGVRHRVLPAWNWLPPEGASPRLDLVPLWVRAWYRLPLIDRYAHAWMWQRGAWEVRPRCGAGAHGGHGLTVSGGQQRIISASECPGRRPRMMRRRGSGARLFRALKATVGSCVAEVVTTFLTSSTPALQAAACGGRPRPATTQ